MAKKPVLFDINKSDLEQSYETQPLVIENMDSSWIPGYSETVKANDLSQSKMLTEADKAVYYKRFGSGPRKMKFEFLWVRVTSPNGGVSYRADADKMNWTQRGYRPVIVDPKDPLTVLRNLGVTEVPPAAHVEPDGTIRRLDDALFYVATEDPRYVAFKANEAEENRRAAVIEEKQGERSYVPIEATRERSETIEYNPN
jgi:hypothetical protein